MDKDLIKKYEGKVLGIEAAANALKPQYYIKDFLNEDSFVGFILDLPDHDSDLTKYGYQFLLEYYGLEKVAQMIEKEMPDFLKNFNLGEESIVDWLKVKGEFAIEYTQTRNRDSHD